MVIGVALVAVALAAGVDRLRLCLLGLVLLFPWGFGVVVLIAWLRASHPGDREVRFLEGVAAELRAGQSLRQAIGAAGAAVGESALSEDALHMSHAELGLRTADAFPGVGKELAVCLAASAATGAPSAALFDEMASLAMAHDELRREVRVAAAPGRVAAGLFVGAPALYLGVRWAAGDLGGLIATPAQRTVGLAGLGLFLLGLAGSVLVLWRAR